MKEIEFSKKAQKQIDALIKDAPKIARNLWTKLLEIASWTISWEALQGNVGAILKYRVWKYRIIYRLDDDTLYIEAITKRNDVYKRLS